VKTAMILLVGEQPAPNLLPTRRLKPDTAVLVYTDRTQRVAENLRKLLELDCGCLLCLVRPYNIRETADEIERFLSDNLPGHAFTFNLTGGTKPMALAAFRLARLHGVPFIYFRTEGSRSQLYRYTFDGDEIRLEGIKELPDTVTLDDYLRAYLGSYQTGEPRDPLEHQVLEALRSVPELEVFWSLRPQGLGAQEVDFVVRLGNQIGVGEVKTKGAKSGIDQISAVAEQRYLGTYLRKFLVSGKPVDRNNRNLAKAYGIDVIELLSYGDNGVLSSEDCQRLTEIIVSRLGGRR
jgi:hypothetical protein